MSRLSLWMSAASLVVVLQLIPGNGVRAGGIGFVEDFALAKDRAASLKQLIPGTEDFYYDHGLHLLQTEQFDKIEPLAAL